MVESRMRSGQGVGIRRVTRRAALPLAFVLALSTPGSADPVVGAHLPRFSVSDLNGTTHSERDLVGGWSVVLAMTDKDVGDDLTLWWRRLDGAIPRGTRLYTFAALNLFPLIPTATIVSQAREATPRSRWNSVWLSRDGSFARSLGLAEVETPWVFVVDPTGRVVVTVHDRVNDADFARVLGALQTAP